MTAVMADTWEQETLELHMWKRVHRSLYRKLRWGALNRLEARWKVYFTLMSHGPMWLKRYPCPYTCLNACFSRDMAIVGALDQGN